MRELWPHQAEAINTIRETVIQGIRRIMVCAPTGSGKTLLSAAIIDGAIKKRKRVAFVVSNLSLIDQTVEALYREGIHDVGVIQGDHMMTSWDKPVQVCSIQTLNSREVYPEADIVIIDEAHLLFEHHKKWMKHEEWQRVLFVGLSATPGTRGLGMYFDTMITVSTTAELIELGYLSKFKVYASGSPDLSGVKTVRGDYDEKQLSEAMQQGELTADIVRTWSEKWGKDRTLCFAVDRAHAKSIQERFLHAGIPCGYQDASTTPLERAAIKKQFHSGELKVVTNVGTLTTGTDWDVRCLILARPTKSAMLYQQIIGRALRTAPDKEAAYIFDHSDTTMRLGFVTEIEWDKLDDGKPKPKVKAKDLKIAMAKPCEKCQILKPPKTKICPHCNHEEKIFSSIMERDGQLIEFTLGKTKSAKAKPEYFSDQDKAKFYSELKAYAVQHEYKPGWAFKKYEDKFRERPAKWMDAIEPSPILSPTVALWIRAQNIRWAKSNKVRAYAR